MSLHFVSILCLLCVTCTAKANDAVSSWLRQMGCEDLLGAYLEDQLENGDSKTRITAATELAELYALLLSRANDGSDVRTLERATELLQRIPQAGIIDLRLQLLRATYLSSEQMLEKYRLRFVDRTKADGAVEQLLQIEIELKKMHRSFSTASRSRNENKRRRLGLTTSLLAWSRYYIAWHRGDKNIAEESANLFASILMSDVASISKVSFDLKATEYGARALLGIALCKDILQDPEGTDPWFEELEDSSTWSSVRLQIPMWKYFLEIDHKRWNRVLTEMYLVTGVDLTLILRLAAVHAMEHYEEIGAQKVASTALAELISIGQLSMVSAIVEAYDSRALPTRGFIVKYIQGDLAYRKAREAMFGDEPAVDPDVIRTFQLIAILFQEALDASDAHTFPDLLDECQYMLGLASFYASMFVQATDAFQDAAKGDAPEEAIWMAIVSLDHMEPLQPHQVELKLQLVDKYVTAWPQTQRTTQLLLLQTGDRALERPHIDDLLAVPRSDPRYEESQRQASQLLYRVWRKAKPHEQVEAGNGYISISILIMIADRNLQNDDRAIQRASIRAFRILEVALHPKVKRLIAAEEAFSVLRTVQENGRYDISQHQSELLYRLVIASLFNNDSTKAVDTSNELMQQYPDDQWTMLAASAIWQSWEGDSTIHISLRYRIGMQLLDDLSDSQIASKQFINVSTQVASAAFTLYQDEGKIEFGNDALHIARALMTTYKQSRNILRLNALIEMELGDKRIALTHWRAIATGSDKGGMNWAEARYHIIATIAEEKPDEALGLLEQHYAMYPTYGVEPFGSKLKELHFRLRGRNDGP